MTSLIHKDLSAVSGDLVEGSNDYLIIRRLKQYNTTINLDSHPWENRSGSFKSCINPKSAVSLISHPLFSTRLPSHHPKLISVQSPAVHTSNLRLFRFKSAGEVHRSSACYVLLACSNHLDSLLLACTQPSFIQFESTPQPGIISW